ncbi:toll/interleukin-1 receptor domain-containing protein [Fructilactobacillus cliffordii]|uniref:macro domain-containing protein n=1 Tax=Fructilactobacillus cliffordii TaxID=2940299 RepID=UPI002092FA3B|nr:macro domain-containing protein [Fructilactobacillus cliffordii]USS86532.1 toll/interleukin-1 receptor domain-containing protein [Fructilactobacillus cliffordii]
MQLFLSWSGSYSKDLAIEFKKFLGEIFKDSDVNTFISSDDIKFGYNWNDIIKKNLESSDIGLLFLTPENINSTWLNFEAGSIHEDENNESRIIPILFNHYQENGIELIENSPLKQFQSIVNPNKQNIHRLIIDINSKINKKISQNKLLNTFDDEWHELDLKIKSLKNKYQSISFNYKGSQISVKNESILRHPNHDVIRVFPFNEYFDTKVNDEIVTKKSLNGKILAKILKEDDVSIDEINDKMCEDKNLKKNFIENNESRDSGKTKKYKLGTIFKYDDTIFFTAMTNVKDGNKATLSISNYIQFLFFFWNQIDEFYAGKTTIMIPLFGSGITRIKANYNELLKIILWTFKISKRELNFNFNLSIVLDQKVNKKINYYDLENNFNIL